MTAMMSDAQPATLKPPIRRRSAKPTRRETEAAAAVGFGGEDGTRLTYRQAGEKIGVSGPVAFRLVQSFMSKLAADQRERYARQLGSRGRKARMYPIQLSLVRQV